jgi:basic membrane lipoprotein Med (substrate-binding protein (PBP1-ABC) superfamily)
LVTGAAVLVAAAVAVTLVVVLTPHGRQLPPSRAREYRDLDACLLTGPTGIDEQRTAAVWSGMQDASQATQARVSYVPVTGPETAANAGPFAQTLIQRRCQVIVAVGDVEVGAVASVAREHGDIRFVLVGGGTGGGNVSVVPLAAQQGFRPAVANAVTRALRA